MTMRTIQTWRDPYDAGFSTCRYKQIMIQSGLTILVGCNGAGKTTLLKNIESKLSEKNIPCYRYDNLHQGGPNAAQNAMYEHNIEFMALAMASSEGENIKLNINQNLLTRFKEFMETGRITTRQTRLADIFHKYEPPKTKERWILLDAIDSGHSIDNIVELKDVLHKMIQTAEKNNYTLYILAAANEYELVQDENCMDVTTGRYLNFPEYKDFKRFILESRKKKDRRTERLQKRNDP